MGTRLGRDLPKPLTPLGDGRTILQPPAGRTAHRLRRGRLRSPPSSATAASGSCGPRRTCCSPTTRTSRPRTPRRACCARCAPAGPAGCCGSTATSSSTPRSSSTCSPASRADESFVCVDTTTVADEEVKYTLDDDGYIRELSKTVVGGLGEAVGHQLRVERGQGRADRAPGRLRRPGLLRARHRDGDRDATACGSGRWTSPRSPRSRSTSRATSSGPTRCSAGPVGRSSAGGRGQLTDPAGVGRRDRPAAGPARPASRNRRTAAIPPGDEARRRARPAGPRPPAPPAPARRRARSPTRARRRRAAPAPAAASRGRRPAARSAHLARAARPGSRGRRRARRCRRAAAPRRSPRRARPR